jgi:hypothetical protein
MLLGIEESVDGLSELAVEGSYGREWYPDEPVPAGSFHQFGNSVFAIQLHYDVQALRAGDADDLT